MPAVELRRAFEASGLTYGELARRLGWLRNPDRRTGRRRPDGPRVTRVLGLRAHDDGRGDGPQVRRFVNPATAAAIRAALDETRLPTEDR